MAARFWQTGNRIHLHNVSSGKNLKFDGSEITATGGNGKPATWKVHRLNKGDKPQHVKLENVGHDGKFLKVGKDGHLKVGKGGKWCVFEVSKHGNHYCLAALTNKGHNVGFHDNGKIKEPKNVGHGNHGQFKISKA